MKIDPNQKPLQISTPQTVKPMENGKEKPEFANVLGASMQPKSADSSQKTQFAPSVPTPDPRIQNPGQSAEWRATDGLLDALEAYRSQLKNPEASLRMIEPYVGRMKDLMDAHQPMLDEMSDGNPVKQILQQAMVHVSKEIERFHMGQYVDG